MPKMSKYSEDQIKGFLAEAFGAVCGGEGEGVGTEAVSNREGFSVSLLLAWKRKYHPETVKARAPRKVVKKAVPKVAAQSNGHAVVTTKNSGSAGQLLRQLFVQWVNKEMLNV